MTKWILSARSVDGTVYYAGHHAWVSDHKLAKRVEDKSILEDAIMIRRDQNKVADADAIIGRFKIWEVIQ